MSDFCKHLAALADANRMYVEVTNSSVHFLIAENERMANELQKAKQGGELVTTSTQVELKKTILDEVFSLDTVMKASYSKIGTVHKEVVHLNRWQQWCARRARILTFLHATINYMQAWAMRYKGASRHMPRIMKATTVELKAHIYSKVWNYEELL